MTYKAKQDAGSDSVATRKYWRFNFRVTESEHAQIEMDAAGQGLEPSSYMRWLALKRPQTRPRRRPLPDEKILAQLKGEAGRVGGNLAQLLRLANRGEILLPDDLIDAIEDVRDFYLEALLILKGLR